MTDSHWRMVIWFALALGIIANAFMLWDGHILSSHGARITALEQSK